MTKRILLISCAAHKVGNKGAGGFGSASKWNDAPPSLASQLDPATAKNLHGLRSIVMNHYDNGRIRLGYHRGNRPQLIHGPDLGGENKTDGEYRPALVRYAAGGFFKKFMGAKDWENSLKEVRGLQSVEILIMSGLYGWLWPTDLIQDYDLDFLDYVFDGENVKFIDSIWKETLTGILIQRIAAARADIEVVDILCNERYQDAINWKKVEGISPRVHIEHRVDQAVSGAQLNDLLGEYFLQELRERSGSKKRWTNWEPKIGENLDGNREGVGEFRDWVMKTYFSQWTDTVPPAVVSQLCIAHFVAKQCRSARAFDYTCAAIPLWRCLEKLLREKIGQRDNDRILCETIKNKRYTFPEDRSKKFNADALRKNPDRLKKIIQSEMNLGQFDLVVADDKLSKLIKLIANGDKAHGIRGRNALSHADGELEELNEYGFDWHLGKARELIERLKE